MTDRNEISPELALVLHRVNGWWSQPTVLPRTVSSLVWGGREIGGAATSVRPDGDDLLFTLIERDVAAPMRGRSTFQDLWNQPLNGNTEDGWSFTASTARAVKWAFSANGAQDRTETVTVEASDWQMLAAHGEPVAWVTDLKWDPPAYLGNLQLDAGEGFSRGHYFLRGPECDYALLAGDRKRWTMVVSERDGKLSHDALRRDLNALAFSFGAPLQVGRLCAVDSNLRVLGMLGVSLIQRSRRGAPEQSPTPSTNDLAALPVVLFEAVTAHAAQLGVESTARLTLATWYFLESFEEYSAESMIVKMLLATVTASRYVLSANKTLSPASELTKPERLATTLDQALPALETADAIGLRLDEDIRIGGPEPGTIVRAAATKVGIEIVAEIEEALGVGLSCLMGGGVPRGRVFELLPRLRALASALIARSVNYKGRLAGWTRFEEGRSWYGPTPDGWWNCDEELTATRYRAGISKGIQDLSDLWPDVPLPTIPEDGLVALLRRHAGALLAKTNGRVYADVWPLPSDPEDGTRRYEFVLRASRRPSAKAVLFVLSEEPEGVRAEGDDEPVLLTSPADVVEFLRNVSDSRQTRAAIERLLLASLEVEQNAES